MLLCHCDLGPCCWKSSCCFVLVLRKKYLVFGKSLYCQEPTCLLPYISVLNDLGQRWPKKVWPTQTDPYSEKPWRRDQHLHPGKDDFAGDDIKYHRGT